MTTQIYNLAQDFPNGINLILLKQQILVAGVADPPSNLSTLTGAVVDEGANNGDGSVSISFSASAIDVALLDAVVGAHVGLNLQDGAQFFEQSATQDVVLPAFTEIFNATAAPVLGGTWSVQWSLEARVELQGSLSRVLADLKRDGVNYANVVTVQGEASWSTFSGIDLFDLPSGAAPVFTIEALRDGGVDTGNVRRVKILLLPVDLA